MELRVMTYNIASGYNLGNPPVKDYNFAAKVITDWAPDFCNLNEVGKDLPKGVDSHAGYMARATGMADFYFAEAINIGGGPYGNALLSRTPINSPRTVHIPDAPVVDDEYYEHRCFYTAYLKLRDRTVRVIGSHFGLANGEHKNAVAAVAEELDREKLPTVLMGDFNMTPANADLKPLYDRLRSVDDTLYTFPSDVPDRKLDYIFVSPEFTVRKVYVPDTQASDHAPFIADLFFEGDAR